MNKKNIKIGIIGCGTIGLELAKTITSRLKNTAFVYAVSDTSLDAAVRLRDKINLKILIMDNISIVKKSDFIIEAASSKAAEELLIKAEKFKKNIMIMSAGGVLKNLTILKKAARKGVKIFIPSGAIAGLDALKAAKLGGIHKAVITTRKPLKGLNGAPYLTEKNINLNNIKSETVIFSGSAEKAVKSFPKNINVSAILSLAGIGAKRTKVKIITSPKYKTNSHQIEVYGKFGKFSTITDNLPTPHNPKTSYLAVLSACATIEQVFSNIKIGT